MEPGNRSGDRHAQRPPKQCRVCQILPLLLSGVLCVHLLHQGVGHPRRGQVRPDAHVSFMQETHRVEKFRAFSRITALLGEI